MTTTEGSPPDDRRVDLVPVDTERTKMRLLDESDVDAVHAILGDEATTADVSFGQPSREASAAWVSRRLAQQRTFGVSMWAVELRSTSELIALCGFFPVRPGEVELGYVVSADHWGQGYATEVVRAALGVAAAAEQRVIATIRSTNRRSIGVARRVGLVETGSVDDDRGRLLVFTAVAPNSR
ncbi:MAG: GNAT family N-acetyltransferase [Ilumatobacteraceae bacterium]